MLRTEVLDGEGVVAEVLFPNNGVPFGGFGESAQHELRGAGNPRTTDGRRLRRDSPAGAPPRDAHRARPRRDGRGDHLGTRQRHEGRDHPDSPGPGCRPTTTRVTTRCGGVPRPRAAGARPRRSGTPDYGDYGAVSMLVYATETVYFAHRPLWFLIWGGVLERFPTMKLVFTESRADWIPST